MFDSVAVVGATGAVGTIIRELLEARKFPFRHAEVRGLGPLGGQEDPLRRPGDHRSRSCRGRSSTAWTWSSAARRTRWPATSSPTPSAAAAWWSTRAATGGWTRRAAGDPGGQPAGDPPAQGDHRQPELLDHADGAGPEAAARRRPRPPRGGEHLSGRQRGGPGRQPRPGGRHAGPAGRPSRTGTSVSPTPSPSTASRRSARPSTRATPRKR